MRYANMCTTVMWYHPPRVPPFHDRVESGRKTKLVVFKYSTLPRKRFMFCFMSSSGSFLGEIKRKTKPGEISFQNFTRHFREGLFNYGSDDKVDQEMNYRKPSY